MRRERALRLKNEFEQWHSSMPNPWPKGVTKWKFAELKNGVWFWKGYNMSLIYEIINKL